MRLKVFTIIIVFVLLFCAQALAVNVNVLDSKVFERTKGKPNVYILNFPGEIGNGKIIIWNGKRNGSQRISSAKIFINNQIIFKENNFKKKIFRLEKIIRLKKDNTIEVELNSAPKSYLTISVIANVGGDGAGVIGTGGGVVSVTDTESDVFGAKISFGPNSLSKDTVISISGELKDYPENNQKLVYIRLEPSGLLLNSAALLDIPFDSSDLEDKALLASYIYSPAVPVRYIGSENSGWESLNLLEISDDSIEIELNHFSWVVSLALDPVYIIPYIPGKYLKESDLLYAMTLSSFDEPIDFNWFPGHAGLYLGTGIATDDLSINDGKTIIEAIPPRVLLHEGLEKFKNIDYHLYMGARRYSGELTNIDRKEIAQFAISKNFYPYSKVGEGDTVEDGFSCVKLTEAAYDYANKSIVDGLVLLPIDQFLKTKPISEISVKVGEIIEIPFSGVLLEDAFKYLQKYVRYKKVPSYPVTEINSEIGMFFNNNHFLWQPKQTGTFQIGIASNGTYNGKNYEAPQTITINVDQPAEHPFYLSNGMDTQDGGGTWGNVFTFRGEISGPNGTKLILCVTKNDYTPWQTSGIVSFYEGTIDSSSTRIGTKNSIQNKTMSAFCELELDLNSNYPKTFYVKYVPEDSSGEFAWVGYLTVDKR